MKRLTELILLAMTGMILNIESRKIGTSLRSALLIIFFAFGTLNCFAQNNIKGSSTICQGQDSVVYMFNSVANTTNYTWSYTGTGFSIVSGTGTNAITANFSANATSGTLSVYAANACGGGTSSAAFPITMGMVPSGIPTATAATDTAGASFTANWTAASGGTITTYFLDVATDSLFTNILPVYNNFNVGNVTSYNVTELTCTTPYYYRVRAGNTCGGGANSNTIKMTTILCRNCKEIKTGTSASTDGNYTIDPDGNGPIASLSCYCDMTNSGGGWTKLNSKLSTINVNKGTAAWSGDSINGTGSGTNCGVNINQYTLSTPLITFDSVYVLLKRTTSLLQCSAINGTETGSGWYNPPYNGTFTSHGLCSWDMGGTPPVPDKIWANVCCDATNMTGLKLNWIMKSKIKNTALTYSTQCSTGDNGAFTMQWFVR